MLYGVGLRVAHDARACISKCPCLAPISPSLAFFCSASSFQGAPLGQQRFNRLCLADAALPALSQPCLCHDDDTRKSRFLPPLDRALIWLNVPLPPSIHPSLPHALSLPPFPPLLPGTLTSSQMCRIRASGSESARLLRPCSSRPTRSLG